MFRMKQCMDGALQICELSDEEGKSWMKFCPQRGGILIGCGINGKELLYLDPETLHNPEANIRGGIPVLFPICGQLDNDEYDWNGRTYRMKSHGFARDYPWEVAETDCGAGFARATLRFRSSERTRASYPFDFELVFTYTLEENRLRIDQEYRNLSGEPMPVYAGLHPYFMVNRKDLSFQTDATRYYDANDKQIKPYTGKIDLSGMEQSAVFLDAREKRISFTDPVSHRKITQEFGDEFKYIVLWSMVGKPFVCVEPFMARAGELNRRKELTLIPPGETLRTMACIGCEPG